MNFKKIVLRSFSQAPRQIWRHRFLSFTILILLTVVFLMVNILSSLQYLADHFIVQLEKRADFMIPLSDPYDSFTLDSVRNEIKQFSGIDINDEIIAAKRQSSVKLPPYWHVHFQNLDSIKPFFEVVKKDKYDELFPEWDATAEREFLTLSERVLMLRSMSEKMTLGLMALFGLIGLFMVIQLFRLALYQRKDEFFIARMVGARKELLISPVVLEGALLGLVASILSIILIVILLTQIPIFPTGVIFLQLWENVFLWEIMGAMLLGGVSAYYAAGRYLTRTPLSDL